MLGGQPNHSWQLCFPFRLQAGGLDFRLYDGSDLKNSEYNQEIPQSQIADKPMALRGRATQ